MTTFSKSLFLFLLIFFALLLSNCKNKTQRTNQVISQMASTTSKDTVEEQEDDFKLDSKAYKVEALESYDTLCAEYKWINGEYVDTCITCRTQANTLERYANEATVFERKSFTKGDDKKVEWLTYTTKGKPCKIIKLTSLAHFNYILRDETHDGYIDIQGYNSRSNSISFRIRHLQYWRNYNF